MSLYLECTLDLCQFSSILYIVILDNFIFTLTWYSKWLDIVNERGLTSSFTISRFGCIFFFFLVLQSFYSLNISLKMKGLKHFLVKVISIWEIQKWVMTQMIMPLRLLKYSIAPKTQVINLALKYALVVIVMEFVEFW